uniref:Clusterin-associated protein 1 n=1 Tax=Steinernema glaseri TaxID=37863 RepID=A0A1I7Y4Y5_9BILA
EKRSRALTNSLNLSEVETNIRSLVTSASEAHKVVQDKLANINNDEQALDTKIDRRKKEYEQLEKRLAKLQSFRPQYMDDYEKFELTLKGLYELYVTKFRNLTYMEQLALEVERAEKEKTAEMEQTMRQSVEKMRSEVAKSPPIESLQIEDMNKNEVKRPMVFGNMTGAGLSDDDEDEEEEEDELVNFDENLDLEEEYMENRRGSLQRTENVFDDSENDEDDF